MGKELENTVKELIKRQSLKKDADRLQYHLNKEYEQTYGEVFAMLRAGHVMPKGSKVFAEMVSEPRGFLNNAYIVQKIEESYPKLASVIEQYRKECREEMVPKLKYGRK